MSHLTHHTKHNDPVNNVDMAADVKEDYSKYEHHEEHATSTIPPNLDSAHKSKWEALGRLQTLKLFWKMSLVCFVVAFSAAADGYQVSLRPLPGREWQVANERRSLSQEILVRNQALIRGPERS